MGGEKVEGGSEVEDTGVAPGADKDTGVDGAGVGEDGEEASEDEDTNMAVGVDSNGAGDTDKDTSVDIDRGYGRKQGGTIWSRCLQGQELQSLSSSPAWDSG